MGYSLGRSPFFYELKRGFLVALFFAAIWPVGWVLGLIMIIVMGIAMRRK